MKRKMIAVIFGFLFFSSLLNAQEGKVEQKELKAPENMIPAPKILNIKEVPFKKTVPAPPANFHLGIKKAPSSVNGIEKQELTEERGQLTREYATEQSKE